MSAEDITRIKLVVSDEALTGEIALRLPLGTGRMTANLPLCGNDPWVDLARMAAGAAALSLSQRKREFDLSPPVLFRLRRIAARGADTARQVGAKAADGFLAEYKTFYNTAV